MMLTLHTQSPGSGVPTYTWPHNTPGVQYQAHVAQAHAPKCLLHSKLQMTSTEFDHLDCEDQVSRGSVLWLSPEKRRDSREQGVRCGNPGGGWAPRRCRSRTDDRVAGTRPPEMGLLRVGSFGRTATREERASAQSDCLAQIERVTFTPTHGCRSLAEENFAVGTKTAFIRQCQGYSGMQINKTQAVKIRKKREVPTNECLEQVSYLIELWRRFSQLTRKQDKF
ncbi:PREDICTED: thymic stromal lymphopoietin [Condylura cristata]|uniref:thymic stromal lymphopoietin n=1 Tax=Condylura cristata TaxID=143302 RepID=UPI000642D2AD|nr:PREDICTED: thymic stromal lymphopoietin [Condylura cristata]